jgi:glycolate oxidase
MPLPPPDPARTDAFLAAVAARLPGMTLLTDPDGRERHRWDETEHLHPGMPIGVAFPRSTEEVVALVRLAGEHLVPLVPRGAGSGLSGGATGVDGALTVVLTEMRAILAIDPANLNARVQPGVINADLGRAAAEHGLFYPPDPSSYEISTLGGNIAENAGGLRCVKYGVTRDYVLGLEVVLADGSVIRTGGTTVKDVMGYDLTSLFVGSEGTLGIVTEAILRLVPRPGPTLTALVFFPTIRAAGDGVAAITAAGVIPSTLELLDAFTLRAVDAALRLGLDPDAGAMLMIESDRPGDAGGAELDAAVAACERAGATSSLRAADPTEADWLREARRRAHWALELAGVARTDDVGVPRSRVPDLIDAIAGLSERHAIPIGVFGHAGDGNLHPAFIMDRDDPRAEERLTAARRELFGIVVDLGGTIAGEHGTGVAKVGYLELQRGPHAVRAMRAIKSALDPLGILNPGKVLA